MNEMVNNKFLVYVINEKKEQKRYILSERIQKQFLI